MKSTPGKSNPFPGLRPFTQEEDYLFFGREEQTLELLQRLSSNRFVAVVGSSGSGKSSLVRCGLLSELLGGKMLEAGAAWEIAVTHPGGNPLAILADALLTADLYDSEQQHARENLLATLSRSHFGLVEAVKQAQLGEETNFLLVVDQFEEIFRFHEAGQTQQEAANEFVSLLLEAAAQRDVPIYVVLTMRSDFIGECGQFEGLAEMVNRGEFLIPRLNREQYKRVIEGPVKVAGGQIAPRLLQRLLNDLGQQADQLPCLQHALMRTWDVWAAKGSVEALDLDDYQCVGKMSQALSLHADEVYASLASDRQRELCQGMFQALTVEEANSRGIRRPQRLGRLCQILDVPAEELLPIIDAYRQSGVTFLMPAPDVALTDQTIIDISHESLMRVWARLRQWVEEETQAAGIYRRLSESADLHVRGKAGLYRDPELGIALAWREANRPNAAWAERYRPGFATAMAFLEASQQASAAEEEAREAIRQRELAQAQQLAEAQQLRLEQQQRSARGLRKMVVGLAIVAIVAVLACVAALLLNQRANQLALDAEKNLSTANANAEDADRERKAAVQARNATAGALAQVESQKDAIESSLKKAEQAEEAGRKLLYTTDMRLAPFVWDDDRTTAQTLRNLLAKHNPAQQNVPGSAKRPDLRGFEWRYYQHLLDNSAAVFAGHARPVIAGAFGPRGQLLTLDDKGNSWRWDLESRREEEAARRELLKQDGPVVRALSPDGRFAALAAANEVLVVDALTGSKILQIGSTDDSLNGTARRLIFSPHGQRLVIVDNQIRWCDLPSGHVTASFDQKFNRGSSLALSADGLTLAVVGHGALGNVFSTFRLDEATKSVTPLARDQGTGGTLGASAMSADGSLVAVGKSLSGTVTIFETTAGGALVEHSSAHASPVAAMAFAREGFKLVTGDVEGTIKIWDDARKLTSKSAASTTLKGHEGAIAHVALSSPGTHLLTTSADGTARVWDLRRTGAAVQALERAGPNCYAARYSPDGRWIATADGNHARLWDAATGRLVREFVGNDTGRISSVAFSPTDSRLLAVGYGGQADVSHVVLWDIDAQRELTRLAGATDLPEIDADEYDGVVGALAFSPDGKYLAAGFGAPNVFSPARQPAPLKVWEVSSRRLIRRLQGHQGYCVALDFSRDGSRMASSSRDGTTILWETKTWKRIHTLINPDADTQFKRAGPGMFDDVAFSPSGHLLAIASREGSVQLWDAASGKLLDAMRGHSSSVSALAFSPDGRTLASGGGDQTVRLWNLETRRELLQLDPGNVDLGGVETLAFSPDGNQLLAGGKTVAFWSATETVWNDPSQASQALRELRGQGAPFRSRMRMLSENLRLHEALASLDPNDKQVGAALAAAQANWQASRGEYQAAVAAYDRLIAADPGGAQAWLRTPGLLRLARALVEHERPAEAAALLAGGEQRRIADGLPPAVERVGIGVMLSVAEGRVHVGERLAGYLSASALRPGDQILQVDDTELTREHLPTLASLLGGTAGTKVRLTVRRAASEQLQVVEVTREQFVHDAVTGELLHDLRTAIDARLAQQPEEPGLLELRAELAGQWSDAKAQVAAYSAAINALAAQSRPETARQRLLGRRGNAHVRLKQWPEAVADFAQAITPETTDDDLLAQQALALAEATPVSEKWTILKASDMTSAGGATLTRLDDDSILASGENPTTDVYTLTYPIPPAGVRALRLEVLPHESLPQTGPGRGPGGKFILTTIKAEVDRGRPLNQPWAEFNDLDSNIVLAIDIDDNTGWANQGALGKPLMARFELAEPIAAGETGTLRIVLEFKHSNGHSGLGRFRLSSIGEAALLRQVKQRIAAREFEDPWQKLAVVYQVEGKQHAIDALVAQRPQLAGRIGAIYRQYEEWSRAVEILNQGITPATTDVALLSERALAYEGLQQWEGAAADWSRAAKVDPRGAQLLADFVHRLALAKQSSLIAGSRQTAREMFEHMLVSDPGNESAADQLAKLLMVGAPETPATFTLADNADPWLALACAYAANGETEKAARQFAALLAEAGTLEEERAVVEQAVQFEKVLTTLQDQHPHHSLLLWASATQHATAGQQHLQQRRPGEAQRELELAREYLMKLIAAHPKTKWEVVTPTKMTSAGGATLTVQQDGSILASGHNPDQDIYTLQFAANVASVAALRVETMPDPSLHQGGSGRSGNFNLTGVSLSANDRVIEFSSAWVDYSDPDSGGARDGAAGIIDADTQTHWSVHPRQHVPHEALLQFARPVARSPKMLLTLQLHFAQQNNLRHAIGRFRLALSSDSQAVATASLHLERAERALAEVHAALGTALAQQGDGAGAVASFQQAQEGGDKRPELRTIAAQAAASASIEERLDEAEQARLRGLALASLQAALTDWTRVLAAAPAAPRLAPDRLMVANALRRWQQNGDLALLRETDALAKLPPAEQAKLTRLWADAAALLAEAEGGFGALAPQAQLDEIRQALVRLNPLFDGQLTPVIEDGVVTGLKFNTDRVTDITPVTALIGLRSLVIHGTYPNKGVLSDLAPLQGMALTDLDVSATHVADLNALRGMPLTKLHCSHSSVADLSPLQGMKLELLDCAGTRVSDLSPLKGMPLKNLMAMVIPVKDLTPLQGMPLASLDLHEARGVTNLAPLKESPLEDLNLTAVPISDLAALQGMKTLQILVLRQTQATDNSLAQLKECQNLKALTLTSTNVTAAGVHGLKQVLPRCKITWDGGVLEPQ